MCWSRCKLIFFLKIRISWNLYSLKFLQHTAWFIIESAEKCPLILTVLALMGNFASLISIGWVPQGKLVSAVQTGLTHSHWSMSIFLRECRRSCPYQHICSDRRTHFLPFTEIFGHFSLQRVKQRTAVQILVMAQQPVGISTHRGIKSLVTEQRSSEKF